MQGAQIFGTDLFGNPISQQAPSPTAKKFLYPPFTVLNAREGWWLERKAAWRSFGLAGECGRDARAFNMTPNGVSITEANNKDLAQSLHYETGTSIFDPVLCELMYQWFSPRGGVIVDPFAGGSVRGVVASHLGRNYWGCDLREEQVAANREQALKLCDARYPEYVCGDSRQRIAEAPAADFVFTCPPYYSLERYSDDPRDISNMADLEFLAAYRDIIGGAIAKLKQNRFAAIVVGDVRAQSGYYRNFVSDTIDAFTKAGANLYNEAILVPVIGSLAARIEAQFTKSRKMGKAHQNVLVFVKGDPRIATQIITEAEAA